MAVSAWVFLVRHLYKFDGRLINLESVGLFILGADVVIVYAHLMHIHTSQSGSYRISFTHCGFTSSTPLRKQKVSN